MKLRAELIVELHLWWELYQHGCLSNVSSQCHSSNFFPSKHSISRALHSQVQTDFTKTEPNKFILIIPEPDKISHITVFMTGVEPFPEGLGASGESNGNLLRCVSARGFFAYRAVMCSSKSGALSALARLMRSLISLILSAGALLSFIFIFSVYFNFPDATGCGVWHYLGYISNEKPSAIFKISKSSQCEFISEGHSFSS